MYWCPFCETLNKATAEELQSAVNAGEKFPFDLRLCPDCEGKTLDDYVESRGGFPWLEQAAKLYGVEATPRAVATALDKALGYNFVEQFDVIEAQVETIDVRQADTGEVKEYVVEVEGGSPGSD